MNALVTGGAGFLGSHLCDRLILEGHRAIALDYFLTGSERNVAHLLSHPLFTLIRADVSAAWSLPDNIGQLNWIFHLASPASPVDFVRLPLQILAAGSSGTLNALEAARRHNARFLLASTSEVYGDPERHPQSEEYYGNVNPVGLRSVYDESKRYAEALTMAYHRVHATPIRIARIFNTYGPRLREDDGRVVPNFIRQAIAGEPMTVYGTGNQTRSFCFVSDTVEVLLRLINSEFVWPVNCGNPEEVTVLELATKIKELSASSSPIIFKARPEEDPSRRCPDISRARSKLGWEPTVSLEHGLRTTIEDWLLRKAR